MSDDKECFFIAPIGDDGSEIRERSDTLMEYIIEEAVSDFDYSVKRADKMDQPGSITSQIIQMTVESDLVIADLTGHNPNVFYELAVRHATGKPCIQLIKSTESIPFDISDLRTIQYGLGVEEADQAKQQIRSQLESLEDGDTEFDNPISRSAEMRSLRESENPEDKNLAEVLQTMSRLDRKIEKLENELVDPRENRSPNKKSLTDFTPESENIERIKISGKEYETENGSLPESTIESIAEDADMSFGEVENMLRKNFNMKIRPD